MLRQMCALAVSGLAIFMVSLSMAQDATGTGTKEKSNIQVPIQSQYSSDFKIVENYLNRRIEPNGRGDVLEVELVIQNMTDKPQELYIFAVATCEKVEHTKSSFEMPIPERDRMRSFVPFPENIANFEYDNPDAKGKKLLISYPKNPREGVNPATGKPYLLKVIDKLVVRTYHVSPYLKDFKFFNYLRVVIFNSEGNPVFRQKYEINGIRH
jgi:hypothetical protein